MMLALTSYEVGRVVGIGLWAFVLFGVTKTLLRKDLTMKEKVIGGGRRRRD